MNQFPLRPSHDPFSTLVSLTAAALSATPRPRLEVPSKPRQPQGVSLFARLDRWLWNERQRDLERALTLATDAVDVEHRLRAHELGLLRRYY